MKEILDYKEIFLQKLIQKVFINYNGVLNTVSGKTVKIIFIGDFNQEYGPDFSNSCVLIDGELKIGDIEVHKQSSCWAVHNHFNNNDYNNVILHIVLQNDKDVSDLLPANCETLVLDDKMLLSFIEKNGEECIDNNLDNITLDCSKYALKRLLKKTIEIYYLLLNNSLETVFLCNVHTFLSRFYYRRRRSNLYTEDDIINIMKAIPESTFTRFLINIKECRIKSFDSEIKELLKHKISNEGKHLRTELFINCVFPIAFCISNETQKKALLFWYWKMKNTCVYQRLTKAFPLQSQKYIWQQQGLIEILSEQQIKKIDSIDDKVKDFSFVLENLTFERLNHAPFYIN